MTRNEEGRTPQNLRNDTVSVPIIVLTRLSFKALIMFCINKIQNINNVIYRNLDNSCLSTGQIYSNNLFVNFEGEDVL
jgi:hypothetical protein